MSDENPYKFNTPAEMWEMVEKLGYDLKEQPYPIVNISRTPLETLWPSKGVRYGEGDGPKATYVTVAFGADVNTPSGPLPAVICLLRDDVEVKLRKVWDEIKKDLNTKKEFNLFPPGWKPAPGFEDPRKDWN